jgi:dihydrofolate synthase/folylpolyglutamate synthase
MISRSLLEWLAVLEVRNPNEIDLGLDRISEVWSRIKLRIPRQYDQPKVITVAGTNGKGSCVAAMQAILLTHNYSVAAFTSPHFTKYNERITINGEMASDRSIVDAFAIIEDIRGNISLTYFEFNALAALIIFRQLPLNCVLLEVGLGGRLDAINIIDADVSVVTSIDLDHQEWLGDTRLKIGKEKLGIARAGRPLIIGEDNLPEGLRSVINRTQAESLLLAEDFTCKIKRDVGRFDAHLVVNECSIDIRSMQISDLIPNNIVTGIQALYSARFNLSKELIHTATSSLKLTGRHQKLIFRGIPVVLDVAHNPAAAEVLAKSYSKFDGSMYAVASVLNDKDWAGIVAELVEFIDKWFVAEISDSSRAANAQQLLKMVYNLGGLGACCVSIEEAFLSAIAEATDQDKVVVFGSFHTVSVVLAMIKREG